jgi:hypothetical protein
MSAIERRDGGKERERFDGYADGKEWVAEKAMLLRYLWQPCQQLAFVFTRMLKILL